MEINLNLSIRELIQLESLLEMSINDNNEIINSDYYSATNKQIALCDIEFQRALLNKLRKAL